MSLLFRDGLRTEQSPHARGKQKLQKRKIRLSFLHTSERIWKTVWMESVEKAYIEDVRITPLYDDSSVRFEITVLNACNIRRGDIRWEGILVGRHPAQ